MSPADCHAQIGDWNSACTATVRGTGEEGLDTASCAQRLCCDLTFGNAVRTDENLQAVEIVGLGGIFGVCSLQLIS